MKVDKFKFLPQPTNDFIKSLNDLANKYKVEIEKLEILVKDINTSPSWKDDIVKNEFINTCNSYIKIYNELLNTIFSRIAFLKNKSRQASEIENLYKRV